MKKHLIISANSDNSNVMVIPLAKTCGSKFITSDKTSNKKRKHKL